MTMGFDFELEGEELVWQDPAPRIWFKPEPFDALCARVVTRFGSLGHYAGRIPLKGAALKFLYLGERTADFFARFEAVCEQVVAENDAPLLEEARRYLDFADEFRSFVDGNGAMDLEYLPRGDTDRMQRPDPRVPVRSLFLSARGAHPAAYNHWMLRCELPHLIIQEAMRPYWPHDEAALEALIISCIVDSASLKRFSEDKAEDHERRRQLFICAIEVSEAIVEGRYTPGTDFVFNGFHSSVLSWDDAVKAKWNPTLDRVDALTFIGALRFLDFLSLHPHLPKRLEEPFAPGAKPWTWVDTAQLPPDPLNPVG